MRTTRQTLLRDARDPENARAWEEFFDQYSGPVQRYAQKLGLSAADASDVLQETMMELIRILPEFHYDRRRGLFRNFVLTIAHHRVQAAWRRRRRLREISWEEASGAELEEWSVVDPGHTPDSEAELKWREEVMREALRRLEAETNMGGRAQGIFRALMIEHLPAADVARRFGVKPNHVYQIKHRLIRRLRTLTQPLMEELGELA